jgi:flagellar basal body rod protein FlgG
MNSGLYTAASGVLASLYRHEVYANNLANIETVGFKPDTVATRLRDPVRIEDGLALLPSNAMLERLGAGVLLSPNRVAMVPGALEMTGDALNVAVRGEGFLVVSTGDGPAEQRLRLTRDGRLAVNADGRLAHAASGALVLDEADRPITLGPRPFTIGKDGVVTQNGEAVARLQLAAVADPGSLEKAGSNLFRLSRAGAGARRPATGEVLQGHLERSAADPIRSILAVTDAASDAATNSRMIGLYDDLMNRAINTFARVA